MHYRNNNSVSARKSACHSVFNMKVYELVVGCTSERVKVIFFQRPLSFPGSAHRRNRHIDRRRQEQANRRHQAR